MCRLFESGQGHAPEFHKYERFLGDGELFSQQVQFLPFHNGMLDTPRTEAPFIILEVQGAPSVAGA
jgi:hypothetical protein